MKKGQIYSTEGTGRFIEDTNSGECIATKTLSEIVENHKIFQKSKMIKLDTDGFDCQILGSELQLLKEMKPIIFFEYDPFLFGKFNYDGYKIFKQLSSIGYKYVMIYENTGDYLFTIELENTEIMEDIHMFYSGRLGNRYCDICVFHDEDSDLCEEIRQKEIIFFNNRRAHKEDVL